MTDQDLKYHFEFDSTLHSGFKTKAAAILEARKIAGAHGQPVNVHSPSGKLVEVITPEAGIPLEEERPLLPRHLRLSDGVWRLIKELSDEKGLKPNDVIAKGLVSLKPVHHMTPDEKRVHAEELIEKGVEILKSLRTTL